jgi:2-methylisocitrate lyase-like PEP mutase family enzyme
MLIKKRREIMKKSTRLRHLLAKNKVLIAPGCFDALTAMLIEKVGFSAAYLSGYGVSASLLGMPDMGFTTMTEIHSVARYTANAVNIPVIADSDTGYGNAVNVVRCIREYIQTGIAGIHLEDQVLPKRCGHISGKELVPLEEAAGKYRAAAEVRDEYDPDFLIIARTDARGAARGGLDEAITRANAYLQAGADVAFVEAPVSLEEVQRIVVEVEGPLFYNCVGISPMLSVKVLQELGFAIVIYPAAALAAACKAVYDLMADIKARGTQAMVDFSEGWVGHPAEDLNDLLGIQEVRRWEDVFLPDEQVRKKYEASLGYKL